MRPGFNIILAMLVLVIAPRHMMARTIEFTDEDADRLAVIAVEAPRMGWAANEVGPGQFATDNLLLRQGNAVLIRVPLDRIPRGQRITKAEWILRVTYVYQNEPQLYAWRLIGDWGAGACHDFRTTQPKAVKWTEPGARGTASDRADEPTAVVTARSNEDVRVNVTRDVELWYTGGAPNAGWMFSVEQDVQVRLNPPAFTTRGTWKLRVTYEPK
jgi:hypothetical protein